MDRQPRRVLAINKHISYTDTVIQAYDLAAQWSPQVIAESKELARPTSEQFRGQCLDFTHLPFVTIDGDNARDYDDAICARNADEGWLLHLSLIHI